jgi:CRP-like cAMP-binding protein
VLTASIFDPKRPNVTSQLIQKFKNLRFLSACPNNLLELLASCGVLRRYVRTESVFIQDSEPKAAHLIVSGMANRESIQDGEVVIQHSRALAGDWLGLANIIGRLVPYMHSAIAADVSEVLSYDLQQFAILRSNQEFDQYLLQVIGKEQLAEEARCLNNFSSSRSYDKLIRFLAAEMSRQQKPGFLMIQRPFIVGTQKYLADAIGTTRETVSRDLQPLITTGIIERSLRVRPIGYTILKEAELKALAASPLRRSVFYEKVQRARLGRRFSDVA